MAENEATTVTASTEQAQATPSGTQEEQAAQEAAKAAQVAQAEKSTQASEETFFDPAQLPPELEATYKKMQAAFTQKTQGLAESKKKVEAYDQLLAAPEFRRWFYEQTNPAPEKPEVQKEKEQPPALSDEQLAEIATDPRKLVAFVEAVVQDRLTRTVMPVAEGARLKAEELSLQRDIESFGNQVPDFWELDRQGLIDRALDRYPGLSIEDAYKIAKFPTMSAEADKRAHGIVQSKKSAVVEKPGLNSMPGSSKATFKTRGEAMDAVAEAFMAGRPIPDIEIAK